MDATDNLSQHSFFEVHLCCQSLVSSTGLHKLYCVVTLCKISVSYCIPANSVVPPNQCMVSELLSVVSCMAWYGHNAGRSVHACVWFTVRVKAYILLLWMSAESILLLSEGDCGGSGGLKRRERGTWVEMLEELGQWRKDRKWEQRNGE